MALFERFLPQNGRFEIFLVKKAHFPTFISYLIAIKSFNKYINRARKVGI